jgi:hypothetical protein
VLDLGHGGGSLSESALCYDDLLIKRLVSSSFEELWNLKHVRSYEAIFLFNVGMIVVINLLETRLVCLSCNQVLQLVLAPQFINLVNGGSVFVNNVLFLPYQLLKFLLLTRKKFCVFDLLLVLKTCSSPCRESLPFFMPGYFLSF